MYPLYDKNSAIKEVQKFLHVISDRINSDVPRVSIDGVYGIETENSVKAFQSLYGLEVSGKVDLETFIELYALYALAIDDLYTDDHIIKDDIFPLEYGNQHDDIITLHLYLNELNKRYPYIGKAGKSNYYSRNTERIVSELERLFMYPVTGKVSKFLFKRIKNEVNAQKILDMEYSSLSKTR